MTPGIERARCDIEAGRLLHERGYPRQAVALAAAAAVGAAADALLFLRRTVAVEPGVVTSFVRYVVRERGLTPEAGRALRAVVALDQQATLGEEPVPGDVASAALDRAVTVVDTVAAWIDRSLKVAAARGARGSGRSSRPPRRRR